MPARRLGELLVAGGLLTPASIERALGFQSQTGRNVKLGSILLTWDLVSEEGLLKVLAALHHCQAVTGELLTRAPLEVVRLLPAATAIRLNAIPYAVEKTRIHVAFVNPSDLGAIDEVSALTGRVCVPGVVLELRLMQAHRRFYGRPIPIEFRSIHRRLSGPAARRAPPAAAVEAPEEALPVIRVPELPIPPLPAAARLIVSRQRASSPAVLPSPSRVEPAPPPPPAPSQPARPASSARFASAPVEAVANGMWIATPSEDSVSEAVSGMWSSPPEQSGTPKGRDREKVADLAVASFPAEIPRVLLFAAGRSGIAGWCGRGVDAARIAATKISPAARCLFTRVRESGAPHFGAVESDLWPEALAGLLGADPPDCAVFPIRLGEGVAGFLYADREGHPMPYEDFARLARSAAAISGLLRGLPRER